MLLRKYGGKILPAPQTYVQVSVDLCFPVVLVQNALACSIVVFKLMEAFKSPAFTWTICSRFRSDSCPLSVVLHSLLDIFLCAPPARTTWIVVPYERSI